jgi:hypothetical protein
MMRAFAVLPASACCCNVGRRRRQTSLAIKQAYKQEHKSSSYQSIELSSQQAKLLSKQDSETCKLTSAQDSLLTSQQAIASGRRGQTLPLPPDVSVQVG